MGSNLEIMHNIEKIREYVQICKDGAYCNDVGVDEIEHVMILIDKILDRINFNLKQCDEMLKDGKHNINQILSIINSSRMIDSLNNCKEKMASTSAEMHTAQQNEEELYKIRFVVVQVFNDLKSQLGYLSSDESTDRQKVLTLYKHPLKPLYKMSYESENANETISYNHGNSEADFYGCETAYSNSNNITSNVAKSDWSSLPNAINGRYDQMVSQNSIPANSLSNSRIRRGAGGGNYVLRNRSNIPHKSDMLNSVIDSKVILTPQIMKIVEWLYKINPGYSQDGYNGDFIPYNYNCGSCAYAVDQNLSGTSNFFAVSTLYSYRDEEMEEKTGKTCKYMRCEDIKKYLISQGPGAHLIIGIDRKPALFGIVKRAGHWFNAYYDGIQVVTVDGQCNRISGWPPDYGHISRWCAMI